MVKSTGPVIAIIIAAVVLVSVLVIVVYLPEPTGDEDALTETIYVSGDSSLAESEWITAGSGTASDPYILSDLDIMVTDKENSVIGHGIMISGIQAHLVIRNITINAQTEDMTWADERNGIDLWYVTNCTVEFCRFENLTQAVRIGHSLVSMRNNTFLDCRVGVILNEPPLMPEARITVTGNVFSQTDYCVYVKGEYSGLAWGGVTIEENSMRFYQCGVSVLDRGFNFTISRNDFFDGAETAIDVFQLSASRIVFNKFNEYLYKAGGMYLSTSHNVTIDRNTIAVSGPAISMHLCTDMVVTNNSITTGRWSGYSPTAIGILSVDSRHATIAHNDIWETNIGLLIISSGATNGTAWIHHNEFVGNMVQAMDSSGPDVHWDDGAGEGNYWDDYEGDDNNHDGIGDTPYEIDPDSFDDHPLMAPPWG